MKTQRNYIKLLLALTACLHFGLVSSAPNEGLVEIDKDFMTSSQSKSDANDPTKVNKLIRSLSSVDNSECLLYSFSFHWFFIRIISYQDTSYRSCDVNQYERLTPNSVITQMRTLPNKPYYVMLPGVHFGTMDVNKTGLDADYINIGTIRFFPVAISEYNLFELLKSTKLFGGSDSIAYGKAYSSIKTRENLYIRWNPGNEIMYLRSPENKYYVMTSYTSFLIPKLNRSNLSRLGEYMNLPQGWSFSSKVLEKVLEVQSKQGDGFKTNRLLDEYNNVYIEIEGSKFLN